MTEKNKELGMMLLESILRGENTQDTNATVAERSGYSLAAINLWRAEVKKKLAAEGIESAPVKRGRPAADSTAPRAPRAPSVSPTRFAPAAAFDIEAERAKLRAEVRAEIEAEIEATRAYSTADILKELQECEAEIKAQLERKRQLIGKFESISQDTAQRFERLKAESVLKKSREV